MNRIPCFSKNRPRHLSILAQNGHLRANARFYSKSSQGLMAFKYPALHPAAAPAKKRLTLNHICRWLNCESSLLNERNAMKFALFTFLIFLLPLTVGAQFQLSGSIVGAERQGIEFAAVSLYRQNDSTLIKGDITERDGAFLLTDLPADRYRLSIQSSYRNPPPCWTK